MGHSISKQLQGSATVERTAYHRSFSGYVKREVSEAFDPSLQDQNEPILAERCLMLSMIKQSIIDVLSPGPQSKEGRSLCPKLSHSRRVSLEEWKNNRAHAAEWLLWEQDQFCRRSMSFEWCCQHLGILANEIRHRILVTLNLYTDAKVQPYTRASLCSQ